MTTAADAPNNPLTDAEITHLEALLALPMFAKQAMGLDEIQGFLAAVISGPEPVMPTQWLPAVLGNPEYESEAQAKEVLDLLMRFYNEITADLGKADTLRLVLNYDGDGNDDKYDYAAWCQAYLDGVDFSNTPWDESGDSEVINELLFPISLLAGEIDPKALKQIKPSEMAQLMKECAEDLPMLAVEIFQYFKAQRARPQVTKRNPGSKSAEPKPDKKKLH